MWAHQVPSIGEVLMVDAVRSDPENRPAFQGQRGANRQEIFDPLRRLVAAMGKQPVISHADSEAARDPVEEQQDKKTWPAEEEQRRNGAYMKQHHESSCHPVNFVGSGGLLFQIGECHRSLFVL